MDTPYAHTYVRTAAGQREVVAEVLDLPDAQWRILLLVNGFTPMVELASRLSTADVPLHVEELLGAGLLEAVDVPADETCPAV